MKCSKCGTDLVEGASFCSECGELLAAAQAAPVVNGKPKSRGSVKKKVLIGVAVVVVLLVIGFATGAIKVGPVTSHPYKDFGDGFEITYSGLKIDEGSKFVMIEGKVKNTTGNNADMTMLWSLKDADGNDIGTAVGSADHVDPGKAAAFSALCILTDGSVLDDPNDTKSAISTWKLLACQIK